jgi:hypothetical protein
MDFLTYFPYLGILVLIIINAILVYLRDIVVDKPEGDHT